MTRCVACPVVSLADWRDLLEMAVSSPGSKLSYFVVYGGHPRVFELDSQMEYDQVRFLRFFLPQSLVALQSSKKGSLC